MSVWIQLNVLDCVCGDSYHMRVQHKCDIRPHKQWDLIWLTVPHTHVVLLVSFIAYKWAMMTNKDETAHLFAKFLIQSTFTNVPLSLVCVTLFLHTFFYIHITLNKDVIQGGCITFILNEMGDVTKHILLGCITFCSGHMNDKYWYIYSLYIYWIQIY